MNSDNEFDKLRQLFSDEKTELPEDLKWEFSEDGIIDKMKKDKPSRRPLLIIFFLVVTCACIILSLRWSQVWNRNYLLEATQQYKLNNDRSKEPSSYVSDTIDATSNNKKSKVKAPSEQTQSTKNQQPMPLMDGKNTRSIQNTRESQFMNADGHTNPSSNMHDFIWKNEKTKATVQQKNWEHKPRIVDVEHNFSSDDQTGQHQEKATIHTGDIKMYTSNITEAALTYLPPIQVNQIQSLDKKIFPMVLQRIESKQKPSILHQNYIAFSGGITDWNMHYGSVLPERQPFEQTILSYHTQLSFTHRMRNNLTLMAGIRLQKMETRFNWNSLIENYSTITLRDTIIAVQTNAITGQQSQIRGDVDVQVNAQRQVRHFNQYQLYQIPFAIGKIWPIKQKWCIEMSVGGAVNVLAINRGRNLYRGNIIDFNDAFTPFMDNRWGFQAMGSVKLLYKVNKHIGLLMDVGVQKSMTNWSSEANVQMRPLTKNLGLGMYYSL